MRLRRKTRDVKADAYVVLATDGIWQVLGVDAVARALEGDEADAEREAGREQGANFPRLLARPCSTRFG